MGKNIRISLILLIVIFLSSNFLVSWVLPAQASAPDSAEWEAEQPPQAGLTTASAHPVVMVVIGLFYTLFGALAFLPLFGADARSGVITRDQRAARANSIDQHSSF